MKPRCWGIWLLLCVLNPGGVTGWSRHAEAEEADSSTAAIERWVRDLDADRFVVRRVATEKLIEAGAEAIDPVKSVLATSNLEVTTRGIFVLRELALSGDVPTEEAATGALQSLAARRTTSAARIAAETLGALYEIREQRALDELRRLGAIVEQDAVAIRFERATIYSVEIGPAWQGSLDDFQRIKWLSNLRKLVVRHAKISNESLRCLRDLPQLAEVDLMYTPLTDGCLDQLAQVDRLARLRIIGTRVSADAAEQFQAKAAHIYVDYKNGAFLGVRCQQPPEPCQVVQVTPGSAAAQADIRPADIIVKYDGKSIADFESLRSLIAKNYVGDTVPIQIARDGVVGKLQSAHEPGRPLGVEARSGPLGCEITKVLKDSEAAAAGLRVGDIVATCEDLRINTPDQLNNVYAPSEGDARAVRTFDVIRRIKTVEVEVTFGEWTE